MLFDRFCKQINPGVLDEKYKCLLTGVFRLQNSSNSTHFKTLFLLKPHLRKDLRLLEKNFGSNYSALRIVWFTITGWDNARIFDVHYLFWLKNEMSSCRDTFKVPDFKPPKVL